MHCTGWTATLPRTVRQTNPFRDVERIGGRPHARICGETTAMDWVGDHARPRSRILRNDHESTRRDNNGPLGRKRVSRASELPALRSTNRTKNSATVGRGMGASYREVDAIYQPICGVRSQLDKLVLAFGVYLIYTHEYLGPELMDDGHHDADNEQRLARHCQRPGRIAGCSRVQSATTSAHCIIPSPQQGPTASTVLLSGQRDAHYQTSPTDSTGIDCKSLNCALLGITVCFLGV